MLEVGSVKGFAEAMGFTWPAPTEGSGVNVSAWTASGLSGRCFRALVDDIPERCAA